MRSITNKISEESFCIDVVCMARQMKQNPSKIKAVCASWNQSEFSIEYMKTSVLPK